MSLPLPNTPIYTVTIPSTKEQFKYRPFLVKEEKALLLAKQSEDINVMTDTLKSIIQSCSKSKIDVDSLATFDIEYLFCQIRAKSVGEFIDLLFFCDDCESDDAKVKISIDVSTIQVSFTENHTKKIPLFDDVGVVMRYPSIVTLGKLFSLDEGNFDSVTSIITDCIDYIFDSSEVYHAKEQSKEELTTFIENLTPDQFEKITEFFRTMPRVEQPVKYTCPVCNKLHDKILTGITNFF